MKKFLLSITFLVSVSAFAQNPIEYFYGGPVISGPDTNHYVLVTSASGPDQSATGANIAWNFNDLSVITETATTLISPTAQDISDFPGTTAVVETITEGGNPTHYYLAEMEGTYLTGVHTSQMTISYTDPALAGYFPMNYGNSYTDEVAGTFDGNGFSGTFTGTASTSVDAYGTLTVNEGFEGTKNVTRLKTLQNLTLNYMGFPVGTLTQTTYSYYSLYPHSGPVFRSITTHIVVGALSIDQTQSTLESYFETTNGLKGNDLATKVVIAPNPVKDVLHFAGDAEIESVAVIDATGRMILKADRGNDIDASGLPAGIYHVVLNANGGSKTLKMVKQ